MEMKIAAVISIIFTSICTGLGVEVCTTPGCLELASILKNTIDPTVDPCDDFYSFVCGNIKNLNMTKYGNYGVFGQMYLEQEDKAKAALEDNFSDEDPEWAKKVKNFYRSCLDTERLEKYSVLKMKTQLKKIGRWPLLDSSWNETDFNWLDVEEKLQKTGLPSNHFFELTTVWDDDYTDTIALDSRQHDIENSMFLGGMDKLQSYLEAMVGIAVIFGADRQQAEQDMLEVLQFEIALANLTDNGEEPIDAPVTKISELQEAWPYIQWLDLILSYMGDDLNITEDEPVIVDAPFYFEHLEELIINTPKRVLANYIMARVLFTNGEDFNAEARNLTYAVLHNGQEYPSRSKTCYKRVEENYYTALEALFVRKYINPKKKEEVNNLVNMLKEELIETIEATDWISNRVKIRGVNKVKNTRNVILYPDELLNDTILNDYYKDLNICPWNLEKNMRELQKWSDYTAAQLLHQQNWKLWDFVNDYNFAPNSYTLEFGPYLVLPVSTAEPYMYSSDRPLYMNIATLGFLTGHELCHLVDTSGRYYNETGQNEDWWDSVSEEEYLKRQHALADEYSTYVVKEVNMTINGTRCIGEIIADQGGFKITRNAVEKILKTPGSDQRLPGLEQYSPYQIFWMASRLLHCSSRDAESYIWNLTNDEHPPGDWRVRGPLRNSPQFSHDWGCPVGSFMNPKNKFNVW